MFVPIFIPCVDFLCDVFCVALGFGSGFAPCAIYAAGCRLFVMISCLTLAGFVACLRGLVTWGPSLSVASLY
jgi:hypothetical protein